MARWLTALRRVAFAVLALWLVVSATWLVINVTRDPNVAVIRNSVADDPETEVNEVERAVREYRERRGKVGPLHERYVAWLGDFATLDWGDSYSLVRGPGGRPMEASTSTVVGGPGDGPERLSVTDALAYGLPKTLQYVVPSILLAVGIGVAVGTYAALVPTSRGARLVSQVAYFGGGLPNFYLAVALPVLLAIPLDLLGSDLTQTVGTGLQQTVFVGSIGPFGINTTILPVFVLTLGLLGSQVRYARTEALEYAQRDFVRLVRAKGAGPLRLARHVLRNAALPLIALFVSEVLAVLFVEVFVIEYVFGVPGIGSMAYTAVFDRDFPLVVGITAVVVAVGLFGTLLQDLAALYLDPRVGDD
ncbi:ABC transporter permease [Halomarina rubra]|uniref:ABC transporter permease n=1 Tax=Halomarina rubra TaxID=2071873 RepID=A0ABD6ASS2_9EURY|nr:ABC transporter permease [Halomarina rubra]